MKSHKLLFICFTFLLLASCCRKQGLFILMPDLDGKVGTIEITTKGGSQIISRAEEATTVTSTDVAPSAPRLMKPWEILETFKDVWSVRPEEPLHFLLYFKLSSADLTDESQKLLPKIIETVKKRRSSDIIVVGHTDTLGSKASNLKLSIGRAQKIRDILITRKIEDSYIEVTSHGEEDQLIKTEDDIAEPRNRRVEIIIR